MFVGYLLIIAAATFWGASAVLGKYLFARYGISPLLLSQARVTFAWVFILAGVALTSPHKLRIRPADAWRFVLLGTIGTAGANFFLYFALAGMDAAVADLIQFTAPVMVVVWMWLRRFEPLDRPKLVALALSIAGCALALGALGSLARPMPPLRVGSAVLSAICYAFLIVWGKHLGKRYPMWTYLHYALLTATLFWSAVVPFREWAPVIDQPVLIPILAGFGILSIALPYICFFSGLKRVSASRAGIVSTWEPVAITIAAWAFLGESLNAWQIVGIALVLAAIIVVEAFPRGERLNQTG
jgi:drug/metabolite transporter, DME family